MKISKAEKATILSAIGSLFLVSFQVLMATMSGSLAILADAWHSGTDVVSSIFVFIGIRINSRFEVKSEKIKKTGIIVENIIACIVGSLILFISYTIFKKALTGEVAEIKYLWFVIPGTMVSVVVAYLVATYEIKVGKETNTYNLVADGLHSWSDVLSSIVVLIGISGHAFGYNIEKTVAFIVAIFIFKSGVDVLFNGVRGLVKAEKINIGQENWTSILHKKIYNIPVIGNELGELLGRVKPDINMFKLIEDSINYVKDKKKNFAYGCCVVLLVLYVSSGAHIVPADSKGTLMRFGKCVKSELAPGLYYSFPYPIGKIILTPTERIRRVEVGFRTRTKIPEGRLPYALVWDFTHELGPIEKRSDEFVAITGDEYFIDVQMVVHYKITVLKDFLFSVTSTDELIRLFALSFLNGTINTKHIDDILPISRKSIEKTVKIKLQKCLNKHNAGVVVTGICLRDMHPPVEVVNAFREVASAKEDRDKKVNQAYGYSNEVVPFARGKSKKIIARAMGKKTELINIATGAAERFICENKIYRMSPAINKTRLYLETVEKVLEPVNKLIAPKKYRTTGADYQYLYMFDKFFNGKTDGLRSNK